MSTPGRDTVGAAIVTGDDAINPKAGDKAPGSANPFGYGNVHVEHAVVLVEYPAKTFNGILPVEVVVIISVVPIVS